MRTRWLAVPIVLLFILIPTGAQIAQGATPTPTPTLSNGDIILISTVVPPSSCGSTFTPCGALPWTIPRFPTVILHSPTPYPTIPTNTPVTPTSTYTPSPTSAITPTPTVSPTPEIALSDLQTLTSGMNAGIQTLSAQSTQIIEVSGTPQNITGMATAIGSNINPLFATVKGVVQAANQSRTLSVVWFVFLCLLFIFLVIALTFVWPLILSILRLILAIISAVKP